MYWVSIRPKKCESQLKVAKRKKEEKNTVAYGNMNTDANRRPVDDTTVKNKTPKTFQQMSTSDCIHFTRGFFHINILTYANSLDGNCFTRWCVGLRKKDETLKKALRTERSIMDRKETLRTEKNINDWKKQGLDGALSTERNGALKMEQSIVNGTEH